LISVGEGAGRDSDEGYQTRAPIVIPVLTPARRRTIANTMAMRYL